RTLLCPPVSPLFPYTTLFRSELDLLASVGGIRGIAEAIVPALVFLISFIITTDVWTSALFAVGLAALASLMRLLQRQPLTQALRSEEHTSELQSRFDLVCRLL